MNILFLNVISVPPHGLLAFQRGEERPEGGLRHNELMGRDAGMQPQ